MPYPPPTIFQFLRCAGVALSRRGYQTSGTVMTRPSRKLTLSASSVDWASNTRSSAADAEKLIPCLPEILAFGWPPLIVSRGVRGRETQNYGLAVPGQARTWPTNLRDLREYGAVRWARG